MKNVLFMLMAVATIGMGCSKKNPDVNTGGNGTTTTTVANGKPLPAGAVDGVTFINSGSSVIFNLYAPGKKSVSVIGDFNNWTTGASYTMNQTPDGTRWWVQVDNI